MQTKNQIPFFAKFLEAQKKKNNSVVNGAEQKEQSQEEQWITKPQYDLEHTLKYPSDGDEV